MRESRFALRAACLLIFGQCALLARVQGESTFTDGLTVTSSSSGGFTDGDTHTTTLSVISSSLLSQANTGAPVCDSSNYCPGPVNSDKGAQSCRCDTGFMNIGDCCLSQWWIIGITLGSAVALIILVACISVCCVRKRNRPTKSGQVVVRNDVEMNSAMPGQSTAMPGQSTTMSGQLRADEVQTSTSGARQGDVAVTRIVTVPPTTTSANQVQSPPQSAPQTNTVPTTSVAPVTKGDELYTSLEGEEQYLNFRGSRTPSPQPRQPNFGSQGLLRKPAAPEPESMVDQSSAPAGRQDDVPIRNNVLSERDKTRRDNEIVTPRYSVRQSEIYDETVLPTTRQSQIYEDVEPTTRESQFYDDTVNPRQSQIYDETANPRQSQVYDDTARPARPSIYHNWHNVIQEFARSPRQSNVDEVLQSDVARNFQPQLNSVDVSSSYIIRRPTVLNS